MYRLIIPLLIFFFGLTPPIYAQNEAQLDEYSSGTILEISEKTATEIAGFKEEIQTLTIRIDSGREKGRTIKVEHTNVNGLTSSFQLNPKDQIVLVKTYALSNNATYFVVDKLRLKPIFFVIWLFFLLVMIFGKKKGLGSIVGLSSTIAILGLYLVPKIAAGANPLTTTLISSVAIATLSLYLAHGFNKSTTLAIISTLITLSLGSLLAFLFINLTSLFGTGSEEAYFLQNSPFGFINLKGLLLSGIIIGTLGVLDDVTTAQTATAYEIWHANPKLSLRELYKKTISVGREHIASLVNTLALAYAGSSLPLFLLFRANQTQPFWVTLNSEFISEEIVRTLVGSSALILAVPISTLLACWYFKRYPTKISPHQVHSH